MGGPGFQSLENIRVTRSKPDNQPFDKVAVEPTSQWFLRAAKRHPIWLFLLAEVAFFTVASPYFMTVSNLSNVLQQGSYIGFISIGLTLVILTGNIDLTVGSIVGLCGCLSVGLQPHLGLPCAILIAAIAGLLLGSLNGFITEFAGINSFIVTIAGMIGIRGLVFLYTGTESLSSEDDRFNDFGTMAIGPISVTAILSVLIFVTINWILSRTIFGREVYAVGGNRSAAINAGVNVSRDVIITFSLSGLMAAISGISMAAQLSGATPILGEGYELWAVIAVVVGGTTLRGGSGSLLGTLGGVMALAALRNGMNLIHVEPFYVLVITGLALIVAMLADNYSKSR
jgi:ribose transport system permease protein